MFGGGDEDALPHQAGCIADLGDVTAIRRYLEVVEVRAAKHNSRPCRGRQQPHSNRCTGMQTHACEFNLSGDGLFQVCGMGQNNLSS